MQILDLSQYNIELKLLERYHLEYFKYTNICTKLAMQNKQNDYYIQLYIQAMFNYQAFNTYFYQKIIVPLFKKNNIPLCHYYRVDFQRGGCVIHE